MVSPIAVDTGVRAVSSRVLNPICRNSVRCCDHIPGRDAAFGVDALEIANQQQAKIDPGGRPGRPIVSASSACRSGFGEGHGLLDVARAHVHIRAALIGEAECSNVRNVIFGQREPFVME
jgi:hypothetical protein